MGRRSKKKNKNNEYEQLTPYQGSRKTFGEFQCTDCENHWMSANSWANTAQQCLECDTWVYPFTQRPLLRKKKKNPEPELSHQTSACGKCLKLGQSCVKFNFDNTKK